jgi:hypothetical protein
VANRIRWIAIGGDVRRGGLLEITAPEFRLLLMFLENRGKIVSIEAAACGRPRSGRYFFAW